MKKTYSYASKKFFNKNYVKNVVHSLNLTNSLNVFKSLLEHVKVKVVITP